MRLFFAGGFPMTKLVVDAAMQAKLNPLNGLLEICDEAGRTLGYFHPVLTQNHSGESSIQSPFTEEELERRRQQRTGRPLNEILKRLGQP
jgi:hypothetical protein